MKTRRRQSKRRVSKRQNKSKHRRFIGGVSRNPDIVIPPFNQFKINMLDAIMDGNMAQLTTVIQNSLNPEHPDYHPEFMNAFWFYCCRDFLVDTHLPNFMQSEEYAQWRNRLNTIGVPLEPFYEIINPLTVAKRLLDVEGIQGVAVGSGIFRYPNAAIGNRVFTGIILYMRNNNIIDRELIRKLNHKASHMVRQKFESGNILTADIAKAFIEEAIAVINEGNQGQIGALYMMHTAYIIVYAIENRLIQEPENYLFDLVMQMSDENKQDVINAAIRHMSYLNFVAFYTHLHLSDKSVEEKNQWIRIAVINNKTQIAMYLMDNVASIFPSVTRELLVQRPNVELLKYALTHGATLPENALRLVPNNDNSPANMERRRLVESWPTMMATYALEHTNETASAYGLDELSDYVNK